MLEPLMLLKLCFRLFRCNDKALREKLFSYVVSDIKNVNLKHKDVSAARWLINHTWPHVCLRPAAPQSVSVCGQVSLNKALQNYVIGMISDSSPVAAKYSLMAMIQALTRWP